MQIRGQLKAGLCCLGQWIWLTLPVFPLSSQRKDLKRRRKKTHNRGIAAGDSEGVDTVPSLLPLRSLGGTLYPCPWTQLLPWLFSSSVKMLQHFYKSRKAWNHPSCCLELNLIPQRFPFSMGRVLWAFVGSFEDENTVTMWTFCFSYSKDAF